jgi:hypothetical protein
MTKSSKEKYKSFEKWKFQEVENEFNVKSVSKNNLLIDLLQHNAIFSEREKEQIDFLKGKLLEMATSWNEYDMSIMFIGPLLNLVDLQKKAYRTFFNHTLKATINDKTIQGRIDGMLAKGRQIPSSPLFFIQEYKPESGPNGDPLGQLLIEMVVAQHLNNEPKQAIYGCYIIGRNWFFVVLEDKEYAVSDAFVATQSDIFDIVAILKNIKDLFEKKIGYSAEMD